ncbi:MAG: NTP transferase domain-containing protein [Candidatus Liptonbacteria bacterium]|nr:NTP transferase domain-containing protein [Candidatus Liptonbacteria bacterium]
MKKITKLVLPLAGLGKRLMPLTRKTPKNLLRVNGKPLIEYVLEEAIESGIKEVILIINPKIEHYFEKYMKEARKKFPSLRFRIRFQEIPAGNGHALISASDILKNEPFAVRFCDDVIVSETSPLSSLMKIFEKRNSSAILLERIPRNQVSRFGVVKLRGSLKIKGVEGKVYEVAGVVEKPSVKSAPSNLIIVGGYVLMPTVLRNLIKVAESLPNAAPDSIPINVALQIELITGKKIYGWELKGKRFDCGTLEKFRNAEKILKKFGH